MSRSDLFTEIGQTEIPYGGYRFKSPFFIRDADVIGAFFLCDYQKARLLVAPPHQPVRLPFNKALFAVTCIEYKDTDIGPYNEVALSIVVRPPDQGLLQNVKSLRSLIDGQFHAYVLQLPVTTEISVAGGKGILNYPKFLADITFRDTGAHRICTLRDKETLNVILELECPKNKARARRFSLIRGSMSVTTYVAGMADNNATFKFHVPAAGQSFIWPRVNLRLGRHAVAEQLSSLGIGQQTYQFTVSHCEGILCMGSASADAVQG